MSWKPEVIADESDEWLDIALRFATEAEARMYAEDMHERWTAVRHTHVVQVDEPVTAKWDGHGPAKWLGRTKETK